MQSKATTVAAYLKELPDDRRAAIEAVRQVILKNLDKDFAEIMSYGMIGYAIPHSIYPNGYHCDPRQPLPFAGLASQKQSMSLYLMCLYMDPAQDKSFREAWAKTGKKLDMGKSCIRFKKVEDLALDVIAEVIRRVPAKTYIERYEHNLNTGRGSSTTKKAAAKAPAKPATKPKAKAPAKAPLKAPAKKVTKKKSTASKRG